MDFDLQGYTHDLMIVTLSEMYPDLTHGADYVVAHMIDETNGAQKGDPFIMAWKTTAHERPSDDDVHVRFKANEPTYRAAYIRLLRNEALTNTDHRMAAPSDAPATLARGTDAWRTYRQALRDITKQDGFPFGVVWPERPDTSSESSATT